VVPAAFARVTVEQIAFARGAVAADGVARG
jgi:hypothetical protein